MIKTLQKFYWDPSSAAGNVAVSGGFLVATGTGEIISRAVIAQDLFRWDSYFIDADLPPGAAIAASFSVSPDCIKWSAWGSIDELPVLPFLRVKLQLTAATLNSVKVFFDDSPGPGDFSIGDRMVRDLPQGLIYNRYQAGGVSSGELRAIGTVLDGQDDFISQFQDQLFPARATWGLSLWEEALKLPINPSYDLQTRRNLVIGKVVSRQGISRPVFESMLAAMGYTATVHEYYPDIARLGGPVGAELYAPETVFCWAIIIAQSGGVIKMARVGQSRIGDALYAYDDFGNIEPVIKKYKPSHTNVSFIYS
jgi:uncharacterized protein YmfQ (DUF2313 family)